MRPRLRRYFHSPAATTVLFLCSSFLVLGTAAALFVWLTSSPRYSYSNSNTNFSSGCRSDGEGSWSIGIFFGDSPLSLRPIESRNVWREGSEAWPVANPVFTCASPSDSGSPSNFVADPFLFIRENTLYLFFETKNSVTLQGDIGVAKSNDNGSTWQHLGIALDEEWHLSYPYVFSYLGQIYLMPESSHKGELRLYRPVNFPLQWTLEKVILKKPLIDSFIVDYQGLYWLFGSDFSGFGTIKNGELEIWYSSSPLGPWKPHKQNPVHNMDKSLGARNAGRPFMYNGSLYRPGQDCGETYGRRVRIFKVKVLTIDKYEEVEVPLGIEEPKKGRNAWNGARYHQLDVQQLSPGEWIGVMDGDRVPSGDSVRRLVLGYISIATAIAILVIVGIVMGVVKCIFPLSWCIPNSGKRSDVFQPSPEHVPCFTSNLTWLLARLNKFSCFFQGRIKLQVCAGRAVVALSFVVVVALVCFGVYYLRNGNGAEEAYPLNGQYSQFTLLTMSYDAQLWNLKMYVKHYSRCSSVAEIVVVWNKGEPPQLNDMDSAVPLRIRVEKQNSLNNRFKVDQLIKTRAVLELDNDIMVTCDDIERAFKVWREHPDRIVGFYPRLADGSLLRYRDEKYARSRNGYNMILTGAAFVDSRFAFQKYWREEAKEGREVVDRYFNCEDILMNFLYANASSSGRMVEYVKPAWAVDASKFSGAAISRNTQAHYQVRTDCLIKFSKMYGSLAAHRSEFGSRNDGWDV